MPYCPKCGVEVDYFIKECPLCDFDIPLIVPKEKGKDYMKEPPFKFPNPENFNPGYIVDFKRKTFWAITFFFLFNILVLIGLQIKDLKLNIGQVYFCIMLLSIWFYLMMFFGFIENKKIMIFGFIANTFLFSLLIDLLYRGLGWFSPVFVPSIILGSLILIITFIIILKKKKTFRIIFNIAIVISAFIIEVEAIISNYLYKKIILSISLFISGEIIIFSLFLLFFYYKIPNKIKKKIHI